MLFFCAIVFIILYGMSWLSLMLLPEFPGADLTSDMAADYSPWMFITYNQVDQGLVEEIIRDNQIDPGIDILAVTGNTNWYKPPSVGNTFPVITISAPSSGKTYITGNSVTLKGTATDTEDGILSSSLAWTSSIDGSIGSGSTFSFGDRFRWTDWLRQHYNHNYSANYSSQCSSHSHGCRSCKWQFVSIWYLGDLCGHSQ